MMLPFPARLGDRATKKGEAEEQEPPTAEAGSACTFT